LTKEGQLPPNTETEFIDASEVAQRLGVSRNRIYDMAKRDEIPNVKFGRYVRFRWDSIVRWIDVAEQRGIERAETR